MAINVMRCLSIAFYFARDKNKYWCRSSTWIPFFITLVCMWLYFVTSKKGHTWYTDTCCGTRPVIRTVKHSSVTHPFRCIRTLNFARVSRGICSRGKFYDSVGEEDKPEFVLAERSGRIFPLLLKMYEEDSLLGQAEAEIRVVLLSE